MNEKLTVGAGQSSFKIIDAVLNRINTIMSKDFMDTRSFSQHMAFNIIGATLLGDAFFDWSDAAAYEELLMLVQRMVASGLLMQFHRSGGLVIGGIGPYVLS